MNKDKFWYDAPEILFQVNRLQEFFPSRDMTENEKLNAITRLSFFISIIMFLYSGNYYYLFIVVIVLILTYLIYNNSNLLIDTMDNYKKEVAINKRKKNYVYPTEGNPFMNIEMTDYLTNPNRESAIRSDIQYQPQLAKQIDDKFKINLYRDLSDVFEKENSQRQFYTTPITTIPNEQSKFAHWLYHTPPTCKEGNGDQCVANNYEANYIDLHQKVI